MVIKIGGKSTSPSLAAYSIQLSMRGFLLTGITDSGQYYEKKKVLDLKFKDEKNVI
jgi:hypothetical protein